MVVQRCNGSQACRVAQSLSQVFGAAVLRGDMGPTRLAGRCVGPPSPLRVFHRRSAIAAPELVLTRSHASHKSDRSLAGWSGVWTAAASRSGSATGGDELTCADHVS